MSQAVYSLENSSDLTTLANNIRSKTGSSATMSVAEMAVAVGDISGGGTLWQRSYSESSDGDSRKVIGGSYLDLDLGLPEGTPFIFVFTTNYPSNPTTSSVKQCYIFFTLGDDNVYSLSSNGTVNKNGRILSDSVVWNITISLEIDNNTDTYHLNIINNESVDLNLYNGGYNVSGTGHIWGNLFYLSPNEIADPEEDDDDLPIAIGDGDF